MHCWLILVVASTLFLMSVTASAITEQEQEKITEIQILGKSNPRQAIHHLDVWLNTVPAVQLELREKLITSKAFNLMVLSEYDQAIQLLHELLDEIQQPHPELTTRSIEILGAIAMRRGDHNGAAQYLQQSLELANRYQQPERMITARIYSALQAINTGQYEAAMELFLYARALNEQYQYDYLRVNLANNINSLRVRLGLYQEALSSLYESLEDDAFLPADRIFVHMTIARSYEALHQYDQALPHARLALQGYIEREDPYYTSMVLIILAKIAVHQQRFEDADAHLSEALEIAGQLQLSQQLSDGYYILSRLYLSKNQLEQAFDAIELHLQYFKIFQNEQSGTQLAQLRSQVDFLQREHQIGQLEQQLEVSALKAMHQRRIGWTLTLSASAVIALLLFLMQMQRKKRQQIEHFSHQLELSYQQLQQTQRQLVASEKMAATAGMVAGLAHELNTPLGILTTAISVINEKLQSFKLKVASGLTKRDVTEYMEASFNGYELCEHNIERCVRLVQTFKQLAIQPSDSLSTFNLGDLIRELFLLLESTIDERRIEIKQVNTELMLQADKQHFQLFLMELISNSIEHGFQNQETGSISFLVSMQSDCWHLLYQDNGKGMAAAHQEHLFEPFYTTCRHDGHLGLGLNRVYNLVTLALKGEIQVNPTTRGFSLTCRFPKCWLAKNNDQTIP